MPIRGNKVEVFSYVAIEMKQRMVAISELDDYWSQSRQIWKALEEFVPKLEDKLQPSVPRHVSRSEKIDAEVTEADFNDLTDRQREILVLIAEGRSTRQMAQQLNISPNTVEFHKANIRGKFDLNSTVDLIKLALKFESQISEARYHEKVRPELPGSFE